MSHGLNLVGLQLIFFELNFITSQKHHTLGQKDPRSDKWTPPSLGTWVISQTFCANITQYCLLQTATRARRSPFICSWIHLVFTSLFVQVILEVLLGDSGHQFSSSKKQKSGDSDCKSKWESKLDQIWTIQDMSLFILSTVGDCDISMR